MNGSEIAIIGMSGRFPDATGTREFWNNLVKGKESIKFLSEDELATLKDDSLKTDPNYVNSKGGFLDNTDCFDHSFFGYNPREAQIMDPQFRIFHECVWQALEDAGCINERSRAAIGVYAGASGNFPWQKRLSDSNKFGNRKGLSAIQYLERDFLTTLISYNLGLKGPSYDVQTACSTSLVAVHLAVQALLNGECDIAMAGGVCLASGLDQGYVYQEGSIFSPDGHCRAFDAKARGSIYGSGAGVVVLKLLEDALEDNDNIYAVIKGTAINNDGRRKVGFTAPSVLGQAEVITQAQQMAEIDPAEISYVETHGTGTSLGDPIEIEALQTAFNTSKRGYCGIGSLKTNIGHLDAAAGVAGLIKTVLALKNRKIPASLNFESPNPKIDFKNTPFYVVNELQKWTSKTTRLAGVSSFGIGGTNAHVVLEEAPVSPAFPTTRRNLVFPISAKTTGSLVQGWKQFLQFLEESDELSLADVSDTLLNKRVTFDYRGFVVASTKSQLLSKVEAYLDQAGSFHPAKKTVPGVIFMFPGQGSQYPGMGHDLYEHEPLFRKYLDEGLVKYKAITGKNLKPIIFGAENGTEINETANTQPALFIFEYALAKLLMEIGLSPSAMVGHSIGEYVAACLAGVFSFENAIRLVSKRGELIQALPAGDMLSVPLAEPGLVPYLDDKVSLAAVNTSSGSVLSGPSAAIAALQKKLEEEGINSILLKTSHAFHSQMMQPALTEFEKCLLDIPMKEPLIPFVSCLTGEFVLPGEVTSPAYWVRQLRDTVRFADGIAKLLGEDPAVFIEVGPGNTLSNFTARHTHKKSWHKMASLTRHPKQKSIEDDAFLYETLGKLWEEGLEIDWSFPFQNETRRTVSLPPYSFERTKIADVEPIEEGVQIAGDRKPLESWFYHQVWKQAPKLGRGHNQALASIEGNVVFFVDEIDLREALIDHFTGAITIVQTGGDFIKKNDHHFIIDPTNETDYTRLASELSYGKEEPLHVIHTWALRGGQRDTLSMARSEELLNRSFYSIVRMVKLLPGKYDQLKLTILTNNIFDVMGGDLLFPENAVNLALTKVLPLEYRNLSCQLIDLSMEHLVNGMCELTVQHLVKLFNHQEPARIVALRGLYSWVPHVEPIHLNHHKNDKGLLDDGKTYLLLGLGGMSIYIAKYIAGRYRSRVIIVHRSVFPRQEEWEETLAKSRDHQLVTKVKILQDIEKEGKGTIDLVQGDITDANRMDELVKNLQTKHGTIHGVIHTAGVIDRGGMLQKRTIGSLVDAMRSKVQGTLIMHDIFKDKDLDFFMAFSSLGNELFEEKFGELGYNAANEFLDAYVQYQSPTSRKIGVNWCDWREVGMAMKALEALFDAQHIKDNKEFQSSAITPLEGMEVFGALCQSDLTRVLVSPTDLLSRLEQRELTLDNYDQFLESKFKLFSKDTTKKTLVVNKSATLEDNILGIWRDYLGNDDINKYDNLFELGASSLDVIQVNNTLREELEIEIAVTTYFEFPTIASFTQHLQGDKAQEAVINSGQEIEKGKNRLRQLKQLSNR